MADSRQIEAARAYANALLAERPSVDERTEIEAMHRRAYHIGKGHLAPSFDENVFIAIYAQLYSTPNNYSAASAVSVFCGISGAGMLLFYLFGGASGGLTIFGILLIISGLAHMCAQAFNKRNDEKFWHRINSLEVLYADSVSSEANALEKMNKHLIIGDGENDTALSGHPRDVFKIPDRD